MVIIMRAHIRLTPLAVDAWVTIWAYPHEAVLYGPARWDLGTFAPAGLICMPLAYARMHDMGPGAGHAS